MNSYIFTSKKNSEKKITSAFKQSFLESNSGAYLD